MMNARDTLARFTSDHPNVGNAERWISVVAGSALAAFGIGRRNLSGAALTILGGAMVWRGATGHCPVYGSLGLSTAGPDDEQRAVSVPYGKGIRVEKSVTIQAAPEKLYRYWRNFENLPRFMRHLESVQVMDEKHSHWVVRGPAGIDAEWDAEIIHEVPNELIGWRSVDGSNVDNAGSVHFSRADGGSETEVRVLLRYDPPAGSLGAAFARAFGEDPANQIEQDLNSFKELIESRS